MPEAIEWQLEIKAVGVEQAVADATRVTDGVTSQEKRLSDRRRAFAGEWRKQQEQNARLMRGMNDGSFRALARQKFEAERLAAASERLVRVDRLRQQYGKAGAFYARNEGVINPAVNGLGLAGGAALATGAGLVSRGFSGTVESNRLSMEMSLAARQLAGAFKPQMEFAIRAVRSFRRFLEDLTPAGQRVISVLGTLAVATTGAAAAARLAGVPWGSIGGFAGRMVGMGAGGAAGAAGASGIGSGLALAAASKGAAGRVAGRVAGTAIKAAPIAAAGVAVNDAIIGAGGSETWYGKNRRAGVNKFASTINAFGASVGSFFTGDKYFEDRVRDRANLTGVGSAKYDAAGKALETGKTTLSLAGGGYEEMGGGYDRLSSQYGSLDDSINGKNAVDVLERIEKELRGQSERGGKPKEMPPNVGRMGGGMNWFGMMGG